MRGIFTITASKRLGNNVKSWGMKTAVVWYSAKRITCLRSSLISTQISLLCNAFRSVFTSVKNKSSQTWYASFSQKVSLKEVTLR